MKSTKNVKHVKTTRLMGRTSFFVNAGLNNKAPIMLSSSLQATLIGRYDGEYGRSKLAGEHYLEEYAKETGAKVYIYRFPNLMGHSRPKYNSAVSTFCWAIANDEEFSVSDRTNERKPF